MKVERLFIEKDTGFAFYKAGPNILRVWENEANDNGIDFEKVSYNYNGNWFPVADITTRWSVDGIMHCRINFTALNIENRIGSHSLEENLKTIIEAYRF